MKHITAFRVGRLMRAAICGLLAATVMPASASATFTQTIHQDLPLAIVATSCTGEPVPLQGTVSIDIHITITDDGRLQAHVAARARGTGVGAVSGATYVTDDYSYSGANLDPPQGQVTMLHRWMFTAAGDTLSTPVLGDDLYLFVHSHITVNANGLPTASIETSRDTCR
jgi:hypothetical protein